MERGRGWEKSSEIQHIMTEAIKTFRERGGVYRQPVASAAMPGAQTSTPRLKGDRRIPRGRRKEREQEAGKSEYDAQEPAKAT